MSSDHATTNYQVFSTLRRPKKKMEAFFFSTVLHIEMVMKTADLLVEINQKKKKQTDSFAATTIDDILT